MYWLTECGWKQERDPGWPAGLLVSRSETIGSADLLKRRNLVGQCEKAKPKRSLKQLLLGLRTTRTSVFYPWQLELSLRSLKLARLKPKMQYLAWWQNNWKIYLRYMQKAQLFFIVDNCIIAALDISPPKLAGSSQLLSTSKRTDSSIRASTWRFSAQKQISARCGISSLFCLKK